MSANKSFYSVVSTATSIQERLSKGCNGDVAAYETGWVVKTSKLGDEVEIQTELDRYKLLDKKGLTGVAVPNCNFAESDETQLVLQRINDAVTLAEYSQHPALTHTVWLDICLAAASAVKAVHQAGFNHYDLHADNVVLELMEDKWKAYVIDFALAEHYDGNFLALSWEDWCWEAQEDTQYLCEFLVACYPGNPPPWYRKALDVFRGC